MKWEQKPPKFVSRLADINNRVQFVTKELLKQIERKLETLKKIMEQEKNDG